MDLIERYLAAVGRQLPAKEAADILSELRDLLLSRVEEKEAELGRPLNRPEVEGLLVEFGHPLVVAARYRKTQHLIGPEVYPFRWATLKTVLAIVVGIYVMLIAIGLATHMTSPEFNRAVPQMQNVLIYIFGLVTLIFVGIDRFRKTPFMQDWKPSQLPPAGGKPRSRFELAAEITWDLVFIAWWLGAFRFRDLVPMAYPAADFSVHVAQGWTLYPAGFDVEMAPIWAVLRWPIIAYCAAEAISDAIAIARPGWMRFNAIALAVRYLYGIGIFAVALSADHLLVVSSSILPRWGLAQAQANFDKGMQAAIAVVIAIMLGKAVLEFWRLWRGRDNGRFAPV